MSPRRTRGGDADAVAEQALGLGLELGEIEVRPTLIQGDHELSGISAELDGADPMPGRELSQKARSLPEQSIIRAGQLHTIKRTPSSDECRPPEAGAASRPGPPAPGS